jgi:hypothetical protein
MKPDSVETHASAQRARLAPALIFVCSGFLPHILRGRFHDRLNLFHSQRDAI